MACAEKCRRAAETNTARGEGGEEEDEVQDRVCLAASELHSARENIFVCEAAFAAVFELSAQAAVKQRLHPAAITSA